MIFVKSFVSTEITEFNSSAKKYVGRVVEVATEKMDKWLDDQVENTKIVEKDTGKEQELRVVSTSTQLIANEDIVSYVITVVVDMSSKEEE